MQVGRYPKRRIAILSLLKEVGPLNKKGLLIRFPFKIPNPENIAVTLFWLRREGFITLDDKVYNITEPGLSYLAQVKVLYAKQRSGRDIKHYFIICPGCHKHHRVPEDRRRHIVCGCRTTIKFRPEHDNYHMWVAVLRGHYQPLDASVPIQVEIPTPEGIAT